tara:strand:+ start:9383 stop:10747 length:1365 start_codon:yes stop_codon:yes gene_type:complete
MAGTEIKPPKSAPEKALKKVVKPIQEFMHMEASGGIVLIFMAVLAMIWANSPFRDSYFDFFHTYIKLSIGDFVLKHSLLHWINDALMVIFFFVVGLEIKREMVIGELSTAKKAALPIFGAIGGMLVPAGIYWLLNPAGSPGASGWGIPMATDIAFAVGILTLLGNRVSLALKIFLLALAIVDDLGAVMVIAIFYTESISTVALGSAAALIFLCILLNKAGVRNLLVYIIAGIFIWLFFLKSGVHATIAGVILGLITPVQSWIDKNFFFNEVNRFADKAAKSMKEFVDNKEQAVIPHNTMRSLEELNFLAKESVSPLDRIIHALHPWVTFFIMPVFALGNAGVYLGGVDMASVPQNPISIGVFLGLLVGKPVGIFLFAYLSVKMKISSLPQDVNWTQLIGVGFLAAIGFTMALFISNLALSPETLDYSKIAILAASTVAAIIGFVMLSLSTKKKA